MTKAELVGAIAQNAGISKATSEKALKAFTESVSGALKKGNKVTLVGFGTFSVVKRAARIGRNPKTGKEIKIKASNAPKFKAGALLKASVNSK